MNDRTLPTTEADLLAPIERLLSLPPNRFLLMEWSRTDPAGPDEARPDPTVVFATLYQSLLASCRVRPAKALEALQHLRSSRAAEELPASRPALSRLEAHAQSASGRMEIALDLYANAADEYRKLGLSLEEAKTRSGWTFALASVGRPREAERVASTAAKLVGSNEPLLRARLETNVATGWYNVGRFDRARDRYRNALRAFENAGATQDAALVSHNLGTVSLLLGETREAEALCARSEAFFHGIGAVIPELTSRAIRLVAGLGHGRWDEGVAKMASLREELQARGDARAEAWLHRELAGFFASVGVLEAAIPDARAASEMFAEVGLELDAAHASFVYGRLLAARGERQEALVHLHRAHRFWQRSESVAHTHRVGVEIARLYLAAGHLEEARRWLLRSRAYLDKHDPHGEGARARALVAELHLERGRPRLALGLALGAYRSATQFPAMLERPQMALVVARAHARLGHASDTVRWARIAVRRLESLLMRFGNRRLRILVGDSRDS
ncbi:MAG: hypothetical protein KC729_12490, partial [Candidatus Eisenbacteria bacterium]|nr:hypothetical protein [Candidatus Eisenbacteria bacterium]